MFRRALSICGICLLAISGVSCARQPSVLDIPAASETAQVLSTTGPTNKVDKNCLQVITGKELYDYNPNFSPEIISPSNSLFFSESNSVGGPALLDCMWSNNGSKTRVQFRVTAASPDSKPIALNSTEFTIPVKSSSGQSLTAEFWRQGDVGFIVARTTSNVFWLASNGFWEPADANGLLDVAIANYLK